MIINKIFLSIFLIVLCTGFASGDTLNAGKGKDYATIQSAVDAAGPDDLILVDEGIYYENVIIKKNDILLIGKNKEKTIIDGKSQSHGIRVGQANNVKISGFTIQNTGGTAKEDAGVILYSGDNNTVANMILINNAVGISIYSESNSNTISGNNIESNGRYGIFIFSSDNNKITNNNIQKNKFGTYADSGRTNLIYSNNFIDNTENGYDNSGWNMWDDGRSGNYWSHYTGSSAQVLPGNANAKDEHPLLRPIQIETVQIKTPSSTGFTSFALMVSLIALMMILRKRTR